MMPAPPARLSTTVDWPHLSPSVLASMRPIRSAVPPGGLATTNRTGLSGKFCPPANWQTPMSSAPARCGSAHRTAVNIAFRSAANSGRCFKQIAPLQRLFYTVIVSKFFGRNAAARIIRFQPQPYHMTPALRFGEILELGARVQRGVVVYELHVAALEHHVQTQVRPVGERIHIRERSCFELSVLRIPHLAGVLDGVAQNAATDDTVDNVIDRDTIRRERAAFLHRCMKVAVVQGR